MDPKSLPCGGPAFPTDSASQVGSQTWHYEGMTLRDYFAAKVMQAAMTGAVLPGVSDDPMPPEVACLLKQVSVCAYRVADAMLAARG